MSGNEMCIRDSLYTASKMMGHADVRPTQIYAKIIDKKKEEAVSLIDKAF